MNRFKVGQQRVYWAVKKQCKGSVIEQKTKNIKTLRLFIKIKKGEITQFKPA